MPQNASFDKDALRTLTEKYLAKTILETDILTFLQKHLPKNSSIEKGKVTQLLSDRTGKSPNSIYKSKNTFTNYSAVSLLRYWQAMKSLCIENNVPTQDIPSLDNLLKKYEATIEFINQIATEDDLGIIVDQHPDVVTKLFDTFEAQLFSDSEKPLTINEKKILRRIEQQPLIQQKLNNKKDAQLERMKLK